MCRSKQVRDTTGVGQKFASKFSWPLVYRVTPLPPDFNVEKANLRICVLPDGRFPGQKFASRLTRFLDLNIEMGGAGGDQSRASLT